MNKIALVTGATKGIGKAITEMLINKGYIVIAVYKSSSNLAKELQEQYKEKIITVQADVGVEAGIEKVAEKLKEAGRLDVLVNNAGLNYIKQLEDISYEDWDNLMNTNIKSAVFMTKISVPYLHATKGVVINISSRGGFMEVAWTDTPLYCVAKAGMNTFTMSAAKALKESEIRVNVVIPAPTETDLFNNVFSKEEKEELVALGKLGKPEEVADLVWELIDSNETGKMLFDKRVQLPEKTN